MEKAATRKQVVNNGIVFGFIILLFILIPLIFLVPFLGIPLLILFLVVWPIAGIISFRRASK